MPNAPTSSRPAKAPPGPASLDDRDPDSIFTNWIAHLDAGRIGNPAPVDPAIAAQRDATAAQFARYARDGRRLQRLRGW